MVRRKVAQLPSDVMTRGYGWVRWILAAIVFLIISGLAIREWRGSQIVGHTSHRFNLALIVPGSGVTFVSFDPAEKSILALPFPPNLTITSRKSGEYSLTSLYTLGTYTGQGGMFARQKIQGFMRVPIPGYVVVQTRDQKPKDQLRRALIGLIFSPRKPDSSLSRFDALVLFGELGKYGWREVSEPELVRAGVIEKNTYHPERLQEFVGKQFFDWGIGAEGVTVAVLNMSGENGLGSDMADFLTNLGFDVVMVRSVANQDSPDHSRWAMTKDTKLTELRDLLPNLFGFPKPELGVSSEYRAQVVVWVGKDATDLF